MMQVLAWLLLATLPCLALHQSDAGKIDWHKELVGIPRIEASNIAPRFEQAAGRKPSSFVVTVSKSNVLATVNAVDGKIVWRHALEMNDIVGVYRSNPGFVVTLSGPGGANLRSYDATTGHVIFDSRLHNPEKMRSFDWDPIGQDVVYATDKTPDVFALTNGNTLRRVDGLSGQTKWTWTSEDQSSSTSFCKVVATEATVYLVGLTKSIRAYTLFLVALNSSTGVLLSSINIPSGLFAPSDFIPLASSGSPSPILAWLEDGRIKTVELSPGLNATPRTLRDDVYKEVKDVGIADAGIFVALKQDDTSHVIRLDQSTRSVRKVWEIANSATSSNVSHEWSESIYSGGFDKTGQPYVARVFRSEFVQLYSLQLFAANPYDGKGMMTGFTFLYDYTTHGSIRHFTLEVANPQPDVFVTRTMFTTSTGALQLWKQDEVQWTREESLAEIRNVEFVDLPEKVVKDVLEDQSFFTRVLRHIIDARDFPAYAVAFARRFLTGSAGVPGSLSEAGGDGNLWRDPFGFRKLLVISTSTGKVFGIDTLHGDTVWNRLLVSGSECGSIVPSKLFATVTVSDGKPPELVLLAHCQSLDNPSTVLYHFEALTGRNLQSDIQQRDILTGDLLVGRVVDAFLLRGENKTVVIVGDDQEVRMYPNDSWTRASFTPSVSSLYLALENDQKRLSGHQVYPVTEEGMFKLSTTWTDLLDPSDQVQMVIRHPHEPVASLGKVLGDRRMLFKYLNPHLVAVLTASKTIPPQCSVYLIDGARGSILYHASVPAARGACKTQATFTQNWLVYHYYDESVQVPHDTKGYRLVSVEFYDQAGTDEKAQSFDPPGFSYNTSMLTVYQQTYVYPYGIMALATTSTKFGISVKDLIIANVKGQIQSIPRRFLDPRRPKRKPTVQEQREEWLIQYEPLIPEDPRRVISHNYNVMGTQKIVTSPALLESTSIILSYGLDLFFTRVAPSNTFDLLSEGFNKLQLVVTVAALGVAIVVTKPMVRRKQMRQRWYYS